MLEAWDLRHNLDSVGAHLFQEWWRLVPAETVWLTPFDANDPVNTPRGLNVGDPQVKQALVDAVDRLQELDLPLDAPLGTVQYVVRNGQQIPIHGGPGGTGVFNAINNSLSGTPGRGYDVPHGSSYIQTVTWDENGPKAGIILTYSQSTDPASPHYKDMTELYSQKGWVNVPYREADILADPNLATLHLLPEPADLRLFWALSAVLLAGCRPKPRKAGFTRPTDRAKTIGRASDVAHPAIIPASGSARSGAAPRRARGSRASRRAADSPRAR